MSSSEGKKKSQKEEPSNNPFADTDLRFENERPWINQAANVPQYFVNQTVWIKRSGGAQREGPYVVTSVDTSSSPPTYVLETGSRVSVNGGRGVAEGDLSPNDG